MYHGEIIDQQNTGLGSFNVSPNVTIWRGQWNERGNPESEFAKTIERLGARLYS